MIIFYRLLFGLDCQICAYWDYSPSTELTGLIFPIFEYTLVLYMVLDYFQLKNDHANRLMSDGLMKTTNVLFWIKIVLVAWFCKIFICCVTGDEMNLPGPFGHNLKPVEGHTLGFFGMQFELILIAFKNVSYHFYRGVPMWGMSVQLTKYMAAAYLVTLFAVSCLKISWASSIFISGTPWIDQPWPAIFDRVWMLLVALFPVGFALNGMKCDPPMTITFTNEEMRKTGN